MRIGPIGLVVASVVLGWLAYELHETRQDLSESTKRLQRLETRLEPKSNPSIVSTPPVVASSPQPAVSSELLNKKLTQLDEELKNKRADLEGAEQEIAVARNKGEVPGPPVSTTGLETELTKAKEQEKSLEDTLKIAHEETKSAGSTEKALGEQVRILESRDQAQLKTEIDFKNKQLLDARSKLNRDRSQVRQFPSLSGQVYLDTNEVRSLQNQISELKVRLTSVLSQWNAARDETRQKTKAEVDAAKNAEQEIKDRIQEQKTYIRDLEGRITQAKKSGDGRAKFFEDQEKRVAELKLEVANLESKRIELIRAIEGK